MAEGDWTDAENDAVVADYFAMLADDLIGRPYVKAAHNRALQQAIGRSRGSIEFKYANVSAAAKAFGQPLLPGYLPRFNFQMSLAEAIGRWLIANPEWCERLPRATTGLAEAAPLFLGTSPTQRNEPPPDEADKMREVALRFDVAERDEQNRLLGEAGEARVLEHERSTLIAAGREDLARRIIWVSREMGDGAGYDILSYTPEGRERRLEVKTTNGWDRTPFFISRNELRVAQEERESWSLFRLWDFRRRPKAFELRPPLDRHVSLTATTFRANFH